MEVRHRGEKSRERQKPPMLALRNTLNILFMLLAIAGCVMFQTCPDLHLWAIVIIMTAVAVKLAECILRVYLSKKEKKDEENV